MISFLGIAFFLTLLLQIVRGGGLHDNSPGCDCYLTNSSSSAYYTYHRFFDFRNLQSMTYNHEPANVSDDQNLGAEMGQKGYLNSTDFAKDWKIMTWRRESSPSNPVTLQNSRQNVWIQTDEGDPSIAHLSLRTHRNSKFSSTAEIENLQKNLFHSSIRIYGRVRGDAGAVAGMFTYMNDSTESDIEILTRDPTSLIHYTNQPNTDARGHTIPAAGTIATLPNEFVWTDWNIHRMDWTPVVSSWYVNGIFVANKTYSIPRFPSYLTLNTWSNGANWSGNMTIDSAAYLEIRWIDMVFNTSGPISGWSEKLDVETRSSAAGGCKKVCGVDNIKNPGFPEILPGSSTAPSGAARKSSMLWLFGLPCLFAMYIGGLP